LILGVYGYHDSGKTLFLETLMKELKKRGISAAAIKHLGRHYEADKEKDTGRLAAAKFNPVMGISDSETIIHLNGKMDLQESLELVGELADVDVIFIEGFKNEPMEKIAVGDIEELPGTIFRSEQVDEIIKYINKKVSAERAKSISCGCGKTLKGGEGLSDLKIKIVVNGKKIPANDFVQNMFWETLCGMARSLKGVEQEIESVEISASKE
jgi:molybdopterin-guanine dinucleotide biosynthesis protein MobB